MKPGRVEEREELRETDKEGRYELRGKEKHSQEREKDGQ